MIRMLLAVSLAGFGLLSTPALAQGLGIERFAEEGDGSVNTWIIEGDENVVVVDSQRSLSAGSAAADQIAALGKPVAAILITHPHPDHFGGLAALLEAFPSTPVYASTATTEIMRTDANGFIAATKQVLGDDAPSEQPIPTETFEDGAMLTFGDISLLVDEIGQGEADTMTMFYLPGENILFTGDLVDHEMTPFLMEGQTRAWLAQLERVSSDYNHRSPLVYPGHGNQGTMALFDGQAGMISWLQTEVLRRIDNGLSDEEVEQVVDAFERRYPDHPPVAAVPNLMAENVRAMARELAATE